MTKPRIAVLCGGQFAFNSIFRLHLEGYLCGIALASTDFKTISMMSTECERINMPYLSIGSKKEMSLLDEWVEKIQPDYFFSICFPYRIPSELLIKNPRKYINFHTGPLPQFRGPMPIFEVLRTQQKTTGISVHFMEKDLDTGPVIFEEIVSIANDETFTSLTLKLSERTALASVNMAQMLEFGSDVPTVIQNVAQAHFYPFPDENEITIDWLNMSANQISALIRAAYPWSQGAITMLGQEQIRISSVLAKSNELNIDVQPGTIVNVTSDGEIMIACLDSECIWVNDISVELGRIGKDSYSAFGFVPGVRLG